MSWALPQAWSTRQFCTMSGNRCLARSVSLVLTPRTRLPRLGVDHAGDRHRPERPRLFERKRRREAVTVLRRIGKDLRAAVAVIELIEVVERLRSTDRE